jgi:hypothetical protein
VGLCGHSHGVAAEGVVEVPCRGGGVAAVVAAVVRAGTPANNLEGVACHEWGRWVSFRLKGGLAKAGWKVGE